MFVTRSHKKYLIIFSVTSENKERNCFLYDAFFASSQMITIIVIVNNSFYCATDSACCNKSYITHLEQIVLLRVTAVCLLNVNVSFLSVLKKTPSRLKAKTWIASSSSPSLSSMDTFRW